MMTDGFILTLRRIIFQTVKSIRVFIQSANQIAAFPTEHVMGFFEPFTCF